MRRAGHCAGQTIAHLSTALLPPPTPDRPQGAGREPRARPGEKAQGERRPSLEPAAERGWVRPCSAPSGPAPPESHPAGDPAPRNGHPAEGLASCMRVKSGRTERPLKSAVGPSPPSSACGEGVGHGGRGRVIAPKVHTEPLRSRYRSMPGDGRPRRGAQRWHREEPHPRAQGGHWRPAPAPAGPVRTGARRPAAAGPQACPEWGPGVSPGEGVSPSWAGRLGRDPEFRRKLAVGQVACTPAPRVPVPAAAERRLDGGGTRADLGDPRGILPRPISPAPLFPFSGAQSEQGVLGGEPGQMGPGGPGRGLGIRRVRPATACAVPGEQPGPGLGREGRAGWTDGRWGCFRPSWGAVAGAGLGSAATGTGQASGPRALSSLTEHGGP